jgi:hypothetical protein
MFEWGRRLERMSLRVVRSILSNEAAAKAVIQGEEICPNPPQKYTGVKPVN